MIAQADRFRSFGTAAPRRFRAQGSGYTWFVRILRLALPLLALVIIGIVIARLSSDPQQSALTVADLPQDERTLPGQIEMVEAKYQGVDAQGRAYTIAAESARRDMHSPNAVLLAKPRADILLADGRWLAAEAGSGIYDNAAATLALADKVTLFHDGGYEMHLENLDIDLKARTAASQQPVRAQGPLGLLYAQGIRVLDQGDMIVFTGPARMTLHSLGGKAPG